MRSQTTHSIYIKACGIGIAQCSVVSVKYWLYNLKILSNDSRAK